MGEMRRANEREAEERMRERFASTIAICASIIAAVRLAREPDIGRSSPRSLLKNYFAAFLAPNFGDVLRSPCAYQSLIGHPEAMWF